MTTPAHTATIRIECLRYDPGADAEPRLQSWEVPYSADMSVLQALQYVKDHLDGSLTFRWSCRMAICGSCGVMINGVPGLSCHSFVRDFAPGPLRIEPLAHFPIVRDLVVDQGDFLDKLESVQPWIVESPEGGPPPGETNLQTPAQMAEYYDHAQCINCLLCYSACPQYGLDGGFTGPAALALLARYDLDSRDHGAAQRAPLRNAEQGVWSCTLVGYCSVVCPTGVDPAGAINRNKVRSTLEYFGLKRPGALK